MSRRPAATKRHCVTMEVKSPEVQATCGAALREFCMKSNWKKNGAEVALVLVLIALAVAGRMMPHQANFTPIAAAGLFAGYLLRSRWLALCVPAVAYAISNQFEEAIDFRVALAVGAGLSFPVLLRSWLPKENVGPRLLVSAVGCSLVSSLFFFVVSNLAVWSFTNAYQHDIAGLTRCFTVALPFLRNTVAGDLTYSVLLFGVFAFVTTALRSGQGKLAYARVSSHR